MKRILHTVSYAGVWRGQARLTLEQAFDKAAQLGYDGVMIVGKRPHASALDTGPKEREALRAQLDRLHLECACIAGYTDFTAGADRPDIPLREMQTAYVTEMAKLAHDLGGKFVRIFTGYARPEVPFATQWDWIVNALRECADRAAPYGVTLAVQNHHDIACTAADMADLLREVDRPNVGAAYDAWAPTLQGLDIEAETERIAGHVVYTTVADYQWRKRFVYQPALVNYQEQMDRTVAVPMGEGIIDYRRFFATLKRHGYDGYVAYEMCSELTGGGSLENLDACARQFLRYMDTV
ncbi:MAG TPA: sugar phosphate isomerase/epimerase family protein [Chthonomonadaceae bacterium]|nr:sugar phosphate isomerase/epimerase family protein [Chthonomonadaceae bacterium]